MRRAIRGPSLSFLLCLAALLPFTSHAQPAAEIGALAVEAAEPILEIRFEGNRVTQEKVLLRELPFKRGQGVSAELVERGRQAILDLGLFQSVTASVEVESGGAVVRYVLVEKYYLLPIPRLEANSDRQFAYGAQLRWNNVFGLNHSARLQYLKRDGDGLGERTETQISGSYFAPFVADSRWGLGVFADTLTRPVFTQAGESEERFSAASLFASRFLGETTVSQGWFVGAGLLWEQHRADAPLTSFGSAIAPVANFGYRDLRFKVFSEEGVIAATRFAAASEDVGSDYDYAILTAGASRWLPIGKIPHETLQIRAEAGARWRGPEGTQAFGLGGASSLRGYALNARSGESFYRFAVDYARPVFWPWLRAVAIAEVGDAFAEPNELRNTRPIASLGLGLRLRFVAFVNFEVEAGVAWPLRDGDGPRFFAGSL